MRIEPRRRTDRAFTLVELLVTTVVLTIAVGASLHALRASNDSFQAGMASGACHEECRRIVEQVAMSLIPARVTYLEADPMVLPNLEYQVPIDVGEDANGNGVLETSEDTNKNGVLDLTDGDVVNSAGSIEWGIQETVGVTLGNIAQFRFVQSGTVAEAAALFDINGDGDLTDTFLLGNIVWQTTGGRLIPFGQNWVVLDTADNTADMNADGTPDPLFSTTLDSNGNIQTVTVNVWMLSRDTKGRYIKINEKTTVRLRNNQV